MFFLITGNSMVPFNDENKLQVTKRTTKTEKTAKSLKNFKMYNIIISKSTCKQLTALAKIFHLIFNYKLMGPVSFLRLPKRKKEAKMAK